MKRSQNTCRKNVLSDFWDEEMAIFLCAFLYYTALGRFSIYSLETPFLFLFAIRVLER